MLNKSLARVPGRNLARLNTDPNKLRRLAEFNLVVCNKSNAGTWYVAIGARIPQQGGGEHPTRFQGWWQIPNGQCTEIGTFPDPGFMIHEPIWGGYPYTASLSGAEARTH